MSITSSCAMIPGPGFLGDKSSGMRFCQRPSGGIDPADIFTFRFVGSIQPGTPVSGITVPFTYSGNVGVSPAGPHWPGILPIVLGEYPPLDAATGVGAGLPDIEYVYTETPGSPAEGNPLTITLQLTTQPGVCRFMYQDTVALYLYNDPTPNVANLSAKPIITRDYNASGEVYTLTLYWPANSSTAVPFSGIQSITITAVPISE